MKIFCVGRNYVAHIAELQNEIPENPVIFMKPATALCKKPNEAAYPSFTENLHTEGEIVLKINKEGAKIPQEKALDYVSEWTLGIDFTARDVQTYLKSKQLPWELAKSFDESAAIGQFLPMDKLNATTTHFDFYMNDQLIQHGDTSLMIYTFDYLIHFISQYFTLQPGDLIYTGTPAGVRPVNKGDQLKGILSDKEILNIEIK